MVDCAGSKSPDGHCRRDNGFLAVGPIRASDVGDARLCHLQSWEQKTSVLVRTQPAELCDLLNKLKPILVWSAVHQIGKWGDSSTGRTWAQSL